LKPGMNFEILDQIALAMSDAYTAESCHPNHVKAATQTGESCHPIGA